MFSLTQTTKSSWLDGLFPVWGIKLNFGYLCHCQKHNISLNADFQNWFSIIAMVVHQKRDSVAVQQKGRRIMLWFLKEAMLKIVWILLKSTAVDTLHEESRDLNKGKREGSRKKIHVNLLSFFFFFQLPFAKRAKKYQEEECKSFQFLILLQSKNVWLFLMAKKRKLFLS